MTGEHWGGVIRCAGCGVRCRTNVASYLDGTEAWVCTDCTLADEWGEDQGEHEALVDVAQISDVQGMTRLL
ncbi:hypothetical protein [Deinococcus kurensis]|uniref:hypothetical protein n=1 Tax=Deinococcus kurensis TaxID=2662757 RepID=UPI0012D31FF0|nr:hypothetical protein [Deinococcus kurensis]